MRNFFFFFLFFSLRGAARTHKDASRSRDRWAGLLSSADHTHHGLIIIITCGTYSPCPVVSSDHSPRLVSAAYAPDLLL